MTATVPPPPELSPPDPGHPSGPALLSPAATPTAAATPTVARRHGRVLRREVADDSADHRRQQPVGETARLRYGAAGADDPELADLLRLHAPTPDVVIMRVSGTVDRRAARLLAELASKQLNRAPHVVIDLGDVSVLSARGVAVLLTLHQEAMARGTDLRIVGAEHDAVHRPLQATGFTQLLSLDSTADAVIASLPARQVRRRTWRYQSRPARHGSGE